MLEVVFNDSAKGSLKYAKNLSKNQSLGGATGYIGQQPTKVELKKQNAVGGKALGGASQDVACIGINLDIGDISGEIDSPARKSLIQTLWGPVGFDQSEAERFFTALGADYYKLLDTAKSGIPIRIWKSNSPHSACGYAFVCDMLRNITCKMTVISLPEYHQACEQGDVQYHDWGEVEPEQLYRFLALEREVLQAEKLGQSTLWRNLKAENAPLRAMVNGRLISVPEDFYDHLILKHLPHDDFVMVRLIGDLLGIYHLGVDDSWFALRLYKMIEQNTLRIVEDKDPSHPYAKVLRRVAR